MSITVVVLSFNEEAHIERCIRNIKKLTDRIIIIDSFSTDKTGEIAESLGARVFKNPWTNHATQFNWALENCSIDTEWTMRMDCDEYLSEELIRELKQELPKSKKETFGYMMKRKVLFMNQWIRFGGYYPTYLLRIWRTGEAYVENRWMDEHVILKKGSAAKLKHDIIDHNLNNLAWWVNKHNNYASGEMADLLSVENGTLSNENLSGSLTENQLTRKRWFKENIYIRGPLFVRAFAYYLYRYIILLGFADGLPGLIFHFLQGFWYRFLVDAKLYEYKNTEKPA